MGKIIKENGKIWLEEIQSINRNHKKMTLIGYYDENEEEKPKSKKAYKKKKGND